MSLFKRLISIYVILCFICLPLIVYSQQYTHLKEGEKAPFSGTLLDEEAMARIQAQKELCEDLAQLEIKKECEKDLARMKRDLDQTRVERDIAQKERKIIETIKDEEIKRLQEIVEDSPNNWNPLFFAGGILSGISLSLLIFWISIQTVNSGK
jgi:hypothetical protein